MNAADAIQERAIEQGWKMTYRDTTDTESGRASLIVAYMKDDLVLRVYYRLYGGYGSMRMMRYYGKDPKDGINWGVEHAQVDRLDRDGDEITLKAFTGAKKKQQVLDHLSGRD